MTRAGLVAAVGLLLTLARAQTDPADLLNQARAKISENIEKLPKYTCIQTVYRARFEPLPAIRVRGCDYPKDTPMYIFWADRFKLDVTVSAGAEIFSWVGARQFQSEDVDSIVGGGMTGTGDFGPFLMSIFGRTGTEYRYLDTETSGGKSLAVFSYSVPLAASHYQLKIGTRPQDFATMAYEGKFWIDTANAELSRLTIDVPNPPHGSHTCRVDTTIDYHRGKIGASTFLLPQLTVLKLWDSEAHRSDNRIEYSACREFQTESVFRTDLDTSAPEAAATQEIATLPPGITLHLALHTPIDSESAFAGQPIEARLVHAIQAHNGNTLAPAGATVRGRIVRCEHEYQPTDFFVLGLTFQALEIGGREIPLTLAAVSRTKAQKILAGPVEKRQGTGIFIFQSDRFALDRNFISEWRTAANRSINEQVRPKNGH